MRPNFILSTCPFMPLVHKQGVWLSFFIFLISGELLSQSDSSGKAHYTLPEMTVKSVRKEPDLQRMRSVQGTFVCSGARNEVICLEQKDVALSEKHGRQIFAKIPGVFVYDMDGTGNQVNISTRGLDPHRGWEFNIRKDQVITNTDMYGYPASHYNIPMEAVERIELIRGTAAIQYGAQFGGMLNYVSKTPDSTSALAYEGIQTVGSFGMLSGFHRVSGSLGAFRYSAWMNQKKLDGYRDESASSYDAQAVSLFWNPANSFDLRLEWTHSNYIIQLAGPLNDSMFRADPRQASRSRNFYNPDIHIPSLSLSWKPQARTTLSFTASAVLGSRNSVLFDKPVTAPDTIQAATLQYANRQVDIDDYRSLTAEARLFQGYRLLGGEHSFVLGVQYMDNDLHRKQQGLGSTGNNFDLGLVSGGWGRDLHLLSGNLAVFLQNSMSISSRLTLNTGVRVENGHSDMEGKISYYADSLLPARIDHKFPLFGVNAQYTFGSSAECYAGWSQAYRPVIFKDIVPGSVYEQVDRDLKDADGYNLELGFRGKWESFQWDLGVFSLQYNHRMGTLAQTDAGGELTILRTNIGDAQTYGVETFLQWDPWIGDAFDVSFSTATSWMDARYRDAWVRVGNENVSIDGNRVESVPTWIVRNGLTVRWKRFRLSALHSFTGETYADALNTELSNASGSVGIVPAYHLVDLNLSIKMSTALSVRLNLNNAFDKQYFTKRPQFYPGPGIWPSDGRSFSASFFVKLND
jgi:Fe(3+) dicitrate transport protein